MKKVFVIIFMFSIFISRSYGIFSVSEIMIDGTQEYLEIHYSGSESYLGKVEISGVKSKTIHYEVSIEPNSFRVIGDSLQQVVNRSCQTIQDAKLSLTDSKGVTIEIVRSGGTSIAQIDASLVQSTDNQKRSLTFQESNFFAIQDSGVQNTTQGWFGSPCLDDKVELFEEESSGESNEIVGTGETTGVTLSGGSNFGLEISGAIVPVVLTGVIFGTGDTDIGSNSGDILSNDMSPELPDVVSSIHPDTIHGDVCKEYALQPGDITIYGVSPANGEFSDEFLILESTINYSGTITLQGGGRGSASLDTSVFLIPDVKYLIAKSDLGFTGSTPKTILPSLSLTDGGEGISIISNEGVLIDEVYRSGSKKDHILMSSTLLSTYPRQLTSYGTLPHIFSDLSGLDCNLQLSNTSISLQDTNICALPGNSTWVVGDQENSSCEAGIPYISTSSLVSFTKSIGDTIVCRSSLGLLPTGTITPGGSGSISLYTGVASTYTSGAVFISEVSPKDGIFPEYIELTIQDGVEGVFEISGLGQGGTSKEVVIGLSTPRIIVVTDDTILGLPNTNQVIISSISLTDGGEKLEVRHRGHIIDTLIYGEGIQEDTSRLRTDSKTSGGVILTSQTPGFTLSMIEHLLPTKGEEEFSCAIRIQNTTPFSSENKINLVASVANKDISNSSKEYTCTRKWGDVGNSSGSDQSGKCNPGFLSFPSGGIHSVELHMVSAIGETCYTSTNINAPSKILSEVSLSSSQNKDSYYQILYKKRKGRFKLLKKNIKPYGLKTNSSGSVVTSTHSGIGIEGTPLENTVTLSGVVTIQRLLPNPTGKDADKEKIVLYNHTDSDLDTTGRHIDTGKKKILLPEVILRSGVDTTVTGTLGLVNSDRCISIQSSSDEIYDMFCYGKASDDQWFKHTNNGIEGIQTIQSHGGLQLNDMKISFEDDEVCLMYEGSGVRCKSLPIGKNELKELKKVAKKTDSTQKKYDKELIRRKKYQEQIKEEKKKLTTYKKSASKKLITEKNKSKKYRNDITFQKRLNSVHRGLIQLRYGTLQDEYKPLYVGSSLASQWSTYRNSLDVVYSSNTLIEYGPIQFDPVEVESIHAYLQGESIKIKANVPSQLSLEIIEGLGEWFEVGSPTESQALCVRPDLYSSITNQ